MSSEDKLAAFAQRFAKQQQEQQQVVIETEALKTIVQKRDEDGDGNVDEKLEFKAEIETDSDIKSTNANDEAKSQIEADCDQFNEGGVPRESARCDSSSSGEMPSIISKQREHESHLRESPPPLEERQRIHHIDEQKSPNAGAEQNLECRPDDLMGSVSLPDEQDSMEGVGNVSQSSPKPQVIVLEQAGDAPISQTEHECKDDFSEKQVNDVLNEKKNNDQRDQSASGDEENNDQPNMHEIIPLKMNDILSKSIPDTEHPVMTTCSQSSFEMQSNVESSHESVLQSENFSICPVGEVDRSMSDLQTISESPASLVSNTIVPPKAELSSGEALPGCISDTLLTVESNPEDFTHTDPKTTNFLSNTLHIPEKVTTENPSLPNPVISEQDHSKGDCAFQKLDDSVDVSDSSHPPSFVESSDKVVNQTIDQEKRTNRLLEKETESLESSFPHTEDTQQLTTLGSNKQSVTNESSDDYIESPKQPKRSNRKSISPIVKDSSSERDSSVRSTSPRRSEKRFRQKPRSHPPPRPQRGRRRRSPSPHRVDDLPPDSRVFVARLKRDKVTKGELESIFSKYGKIVEIRLHHTYGFVQFTNPRSAQAAIDNEKGRKIQGVSIDLNLATNKSIPSDDLEHSRRLSPNPSSFSRKTRADYRKFDHAGPPPKHIKRDPSPSNAPDCVVIASDKKPGMREQAIDLRHDLKQERVKAEMTMLRPRETLSEVLRECRRDGVLVAAVLTPSPGPQTVDVHVLQGQREVKQRIPINSCIDLIKQVFRDRHAVPPAAYDAQISRQQYSHAHPSQSMHHGSAVSAHEGILPTPPPRHDQESRRHYPPSTHEQRRYMDIEEIYHRRDIGHPGQQQGYPVARAGLPPPQMARRIPPTSYHSHDEIHERPPPMRHYPNHPASMEQSRRVQSRPIEGIPHAGGAADVRVPHQRIDEYDRFLGSGHDPDIPTVRGLDVQPHISARAAAEAYKYAGEEDDDIRQNVRFLEQVHHYPSNHLRPELSETRRVSPVPRLQPHLSNSMRETHTSQGRHSSIAPEADHYHHSPLAAPSLPHPQLKGVSLPPRSELSVDFKEAQLQNRDYELFHHQRTGRIQELSRMPVTTVTRHAYSPAEEMSLKMGISRADPMSDSHQHQRPASQTARTQTQALTSQIYEILGRDASRVQQQHRQVQTPQQSYESPQMTIEDPRSRLRHQPLPRDTQSYGGATHSPGHPGEDIDLNNPAIQNMLSALLKEAG